MAILPSVQPKPAKFLTKSLLYISSSIISTISLFLSSFQDARGRVTRKVLTGSGLLKETEDNDDDANDENDGPKNDFWNLSNDEYYNPRLVDSVGKNLGSLNLQHATPAVELCGQLFPTHLNATKLRHFHRPTIKKAVHGKVKAGEYHPVQSMQKIAETRATVYSSSCFSFHPH